VAPHANAIRTMHAAGAAKPSHNCQGPWGGSFVSLPDAGRSDRLKLPSCSPRGPGISSSYAPQTCRARDPRPTDQTNWEGAHDLDFEVGENRG
jgi:hypothetical protein